jgi:hypothetical protein
MGIRSILARPFASWVVSKQKNWMRFPGQAQESVFQNLMSKAADTRFGKDHGLKEVKTHADFIRRVPIRDYEALKDYVALVKEGNPDLGHHQRNEVYSHYQRIHSQPHSGCKRRPAELCVPHRQGRIS